MTQPEVTVVYTDGACSGNPGPGGWAWAVPGGRFASGAEARSTNQRMEIKAVLEAVRTLEGPLEVTSDSTYVINCFRDRWWEGWLRKGWINSQRKPVANRDLWEPLIELYRAEPTRVRFTWVKGHSDDKWNDVVDRLAVEAARRQQGRTGDEPPAELGPADAPGAVTMVDDGAPPGRRLAIVGHRAADLGGFGENPVAASVRKRMVEILAAKHELHPDLVVLSGLGLGAEQLGAEAAIEAGLPFVAVLAYPSPDSVWPPASRERFRSLLAAATSTVVLSPRDPDSKAAAGRALNRRDGWLARHADEAIAVWDGDDPAVGKLIRSLQDAVGEEDVWILPPA